MWEGKKNGQHDRGKGGWVAHCDIDTKEADVMVVGVKSHEAVGQVIQGELLGKLAACMSTCSGKCVSLCNDTRMMMLKIELHAFYVHKMSTD